MYHLNSDGVKVPVQCSHLNETGFKPMSNRVLVKIRKVEEKTKSGIILSGVINEEQQLLNACYATIVDIGDFAFLDWEFVPEIGDKCTFERYKGIPFKPKREMLDSDKEEYRLLQSNEITTIDTNPNNEE